MRYISITILVHRIVLIYFHFRHYAFKRSGYCINRKDTEAVSRIPFCRSSFLPLFFLPLWEKPAALSQWAFHLFPGRATYCHAVRRCPQDICKCKKRVRIIPDSLCSRYRSVPGRPTYCHAVRNSPVDCCRHKKASYFRRRSCVRVTYLPGQSPAKYCRRT